MTYSAATFWTEAPKERYANLEWRKRLLLRCRNDAGAQRAMREACKQDLLFYVNAFVCTYDPRTQHKLLPFVTWPVQDKAFKAILDCIENGVDLVIEKSRDMGASWMSLVTMEWLWHFHPGNSFLMISRKEDLVDAPGDPDSLFWKVDFIHRHLPDWLRPRTDRRKLHFGNLDLDSTIDGESTTAAAGVGGRRTAIFIDEFSRIEEGYLLLAGTADTTRCRIFNFTPFGTSNAAYKLARRGDVRKLRLHWSEHPEKAAGLYQYNAGTNRVDVIDKQFRFAPDFDFIMDGRLRSPWYDGECKRRANDREIAEMLDIDYQGSQHQFFDRATIVELQRTYARSPDWEGDISFDPDTGRPIELTKASGGPLKLWCTLTHDGKPPPGMYAAGADISAGTGATNSCISIGNCETGEKVGEYVSPYLRADQLAPRATALCWLFYEALFAWEIPGPGITFGNKVIEFGYRNVYYRTREDKITKVSTDAYGWVANPDNTEAVLTEYRAALASRQFLNRSVEALEECLNFMHARGGKVQHSELMDTVDPTGARGNHGDRTIADALAWKMMKTIYVPRKTAMEIQAGPGSLAWRRQLAENSDREKARW